MAPGQPAPSLLARRPAMALITFIPLVWLIAVTFTAGAQKIWHPDVRIGFLAQARTLEKKQPALVEAFAQACSAGDAQAIAAAEKALKTNRVLRFNNVLDAFIAGIFLLLVGVILVLSAWEWVMLLRRSRPVRLCETEPVWLPEYAVAEGSPLKTVGAAGLALALARELSGEARMDRDREMALLPAPVCHEEAAGACCSHHEPATLTSRQTEAERYVRVTEERFKGVRRCC